MKTFTIEPAEKIVTQFGVEKTVKIPELNRFITVVGDIKEEFCIQDFITQIRLIESQIKNIKRAGENKPEEIASLFAEMNKYRNKINEVKTQFLLKIALPVIKTDKILSNELVSEKQPIEGLIIK